MAEAIINQELAESWVAVSAGTKPAGYVHPLALKALKEIDIKTENLVSKSTELFKNEQIDLVITVCGEAEKDCPVWLGTEQKTHIGFPDPADATGSEDEILSVFRQVRDDIQSQIIPYLTNV